MLVHTRLGEFNYYNQNGSVYLSINYDPDYESLLDSTEIASVSVDSLTLEKTFYTNGAVNEESLFTSNGSPHGTKAKYTKKGNIVYSIQFNNGVNNGTSVFYFPNGNVMSSTEFKDGLKHGENITYDSKGKVKSVKVYKKR
ncbi:MAG: hypothetical protein HRT57_14825 [Crocinitomicaceae bacterium]|nr:hypothetical protein [Crocinitomicaceae bacterium]